MCFYDIIKSLKSFCYAVLSCARNKRHFYLFQLPSRNKRLTGSEYQSVKIVIFQEIGKKLSLNDILLDANHKRIICYCALSRIIVYPTGICSNTSNQYNVPIELHSICFAHNTG